MLDYTEQVIYLKEPSKKRQVYTSNVSGGKSKLTTDQTQQNLRQTMSSLDQTCTRQSAAELNPSTLNNDLNYMRMETGPTVLTTANRTSYRSKTAASSSTLK